MQIVIDIPDGCYEELCNARFPIQDAYRLVTWIKEGAPLPKGHGRLIDADALVESDCYWETEYDVTNAPTIIEADKEVQDDSNGAN